MTRFRYYLPQHQSPSFYNLAKHLQARGWRRTSWRWRAHFDTRNFEFNSAAAECLEFKHLLAELVAACEPSLMPESYYIDDENWQAVLPQLDNSAWILKPSLLNNGQHIKIFTTLSEIAQHFQNTNRLGGPHIIQRYITEPYLLKAHKFSMRLFVVLTNYDGAYLYPQGYFNVAKQPYEKNNYVNLQPHVTNEHLAEDDANVIQIPSRLFDFFPSCYATIKMMLARILEQLYLSHVAALTDEQPRTLAIFGFDFLMNEQQRIWLLEANHGPCFPVSDEHPLQEHLYNDFWRDFIESFVMGIAERKMVGNIKYENFERIHSVSKY